MLLKVNAKNKESTDFEFSKLFFFTSS